MGEADSRSYCRWIKANVEKISQKREEAMGEKETVGNRESGAPGLLRPSDGGFELFGGEPADGANPAADPANRSGGRAGFYLWRKRRGKRSCRADDSLAFEAAQPGVCESELRGAAGRAAGIGTVRI